MDIHIAFGILSGFMNSLGVFEHIPHRQRGAVVLSDCYVSVLGYMQCCTNGQDRVLVFKSTIFYAHTWRHIYIHMDIGSNYIGTLNILKCMLYPNKYKILKKHRKVAQIPILHHLAWLFKGEDI